jgi:hypothetical protein
MTIMLCPVTDEQLLLSVHGELDLLTMARVAAHTATCAACRARRAEFQRAAVATANLIRDPALPAWSGGWLHGANGVVVGGVSALATALSLAYLAFWVSAHSPMVAPTAHYAVSGYAHHCKHRASAASNIASAPADHCKAAAACPSSGSDTSGSKP